MGMYNLDKKFQKTRLIISGTSSDPPAGWFPAALMLLAPPTSGITTAAYNMSEKYTYSFDLNAALQLFSIAYLPLG